MLVRPMHPTMSKSLMVLLHIRQISLAWKTFPWHCMHFHVTPPAPKKVEILTRGVLGVPTVPHGHFLSIQACFVFIHAGTLSPTVLQYE